MSYRDQTMSKHILIIGGMGPQASIHAHSRLIELSQQGSAEPQNDNYPRITHLSINVKDFIADGRSKDDAQKYILGCLKDVDLDSVDVGFIACNTAHILFNEIQQAAGGKLTSIVEATQSYLGKKKIGLVATPSTIKYNLYGDKISVLPNEKSLKNIENIIRRVISGEHVEKLRPLLNVEISKLQRRGAERVVLGCTELSMFAQLLDPAIIIDPIDLTIREILEDQKDA